MKPQDMMNPFTSNKWRFAGAVCSVFASSVLLSACGGGGGSTPVEIPEAVVSSVANGAVLEGNTGGTQLKFLVTLSKPAVRGVDVFYTTASTAKTDVDNSTGSAKGVASSCPVVPNADADYVNVSAEKLSIAPGFREGFLIVNVCSDVIFEPNETLKLVWSSGSAGGTAIGTIINDDVGGLNSTGATTVMGGVAAFGRDTQSLTNLDTDGGAKGFSFAKRQSDASWNCTHDNVTGLNWLRPWTSGQAYSNIATAVNAANSASSCGSTDWRAPTVNELLSLMDMSRAAAYGAVNADREGVADLAMDDRFWTSEVVNNASDNAWIVDSTNGGAVSPVNKNSSNGIRLVSGQPLTNGNSRATVCNDSSRYKDFGDQTVEDVKTGLMWKQCREGASGADCGGERTVFDSDLAIVAHVKNVNANPISLGLGYSDWRTPTVKELSSLVDRCTNNSNSPAINATNFPNNTSTSFVTSSVNVNATNSNDRYWYVDFAQGTIAVGPPTGKYLRLVRAGQ